MAVEDIRKKVKKLKAKSISYYPDSFRVDSKYHNCRSFDTTHTETVVYFLDVLQRLPSVVHIVPLSLPVLLMHLLKALLGLLLCLCQ